MPFNSSAMKRRRTLLNISQHNLGIMAGLHPTTIAKIERGALPNDGGGIGIDAFMRIAAALQMEYYELLIQPTGNRYERAVEFARNQHSPLQAPLLHDQGRSIRAQGLRKITSKRAGDTLDEVLEPEQDDEALYTRDLPPFVHTPAKPIPVDGDDEYDFHPDPSSE